MSLLNENSPRETDMKAVIKDILTNKVDMLLTKSDSDTMLIMCSIFSISLLESEKSIFTSLV